MKGVFDLILPKWKTHYHEFSSDLRTGDIVLVAGVYPGSWVVRALQLGNKWGHVAMVVRARDIDPHDIFKLPDPLLWESNTFMEASAINYWGSERKVKEGPMLVSMTDRLTHTVREGEKVRLAVKRLQTESVLPYEVLPSLFDSVIDKTFPSEKEIIHSAYLGRRFNQVSADALNAINLAIDEYTGQVAFMGFTENLLATPTSDEDTVDKPRLYCSELLALTYKNLGLLTQRHVSNAYSPKDFSDDGDIRLLQGAWLMNEMEFELDID